MRVERILETTLYVSDLDRAEEFYRRVLGLIPFSREGGRHLFFRCGQGVFLLFNADKTSAPGSDIPEHGSRGPGHVAFGIREAEIGPWRAHLESQQVLIERDLEWPGGGHSLYFRDPDGNSLELATPALWGLSE